MFSSLSLVCEDIFNLCSFFHAISWSHVEKAGNIVVHLLDKSSSLKLGEHVWLGGIPEFIVDYVACDIFEIHMQEISHFPFKENQNKRVTS